MMLNNHVFGSDLVKPIVEDGLIVHLDASNPLSYSGTGLTWHDLSPHGNDFTLDVSGITFNPTGAFDLFGGGGATHSGAITASTTCTVQFWMETDDAQALFLSQSTGEYLGAYRVANKEYHSGFGTPIFTLDTIDMPNIYDYNRVKTWHLYEFKNVNLSNITSILFNQYTNFTFDSGAIGAIAIYDRNLTQEESIQNLDSFRYGTDYVESSLDTVNYVQTGISEDALVAYFDASYTESYQEGAVVWNDISGNGNNCLLVGGTVFEPITKSLYFDGVDDVGLADIARTSDCTFTILAKSDVINDKDMLFNGGADGQGADLFFSGGNIYWNTWDATANLICPIPVSSYDGNLHTYVLENNATENITRLYYDNVLIGTANYKSASSTLNLYIGGTASDYKWNGYIATFCVHNKILTEAERLQNHNELMART